MHRAVGARLAATERRADLANVLWSLHQALYGGLLVIAATVACCLLELLLAGAFAAVTEVQVQLGDPRHIVQLAQHRTQRELLYFNHDWKCLWHCALLFAPRARLIPCEGGTFLEQTMAV